MDFSNGKLDIIIGTMFSGKTSYMLSKISIFSDLGFKILYININFDTRSESEFSTHNPFINQGEFKKNINVKKNLTMLKCEVRLESIDFIDYDIILIDEAHFFEDLVPFTQLLLKHKKYIIISSLSADFKGENFGHITELIPICDEIHKLHTYCGICAKDKKCNPAIFSKKIIIDDSIISIGGIEKYIPVCRKHYD